MEHDLPEYPGCHPALLDRLQAEADDVITMVGASWGNVIRLSKVILDWSLLKAAFQCWDHERGVFRFGENHMCPTLEEIAYMMDMQLEDDIPFPVAKQGFRAEISIFLKCRKNQLEMINDNAVSIEFLLKRSITNRTPQDPAKDAEGKKHALLLAIVGHLLFPQDRESVHPRLITVLRQLEEVERESRKPGITLVPMVLAEILRSLTAVKASRIWPFQGSLQLLQLWLIQHLPFLVISNGKPLAPKPMLQDVDILLTQPQSAYLTLEEYSGRLQMTREEEIQWKIGMSIQKGCTQPRLAAEGRHSMVLAGLYGSTPYVPLLVLRQFGYKQIVPTCDNTTGEIIEFEKYCAAMERRFKEHWASSKRELAVTPVIPLFTCAPMYREWIRNPNISSPWAPPAEIPTPVRPPSHGTISKASLKRPLEDLFLQAAISLHLQNKKNEGQEAAKAKAQEDYLQEEILRAQTSLAEAKATLKQVEEKLGQALQEKHEAELRAQQFQNEVVEIRKRMQVNATRDVIATAWMSSRIAKLEDKLRWHGIDIPPPLPRPFKQ
ncbi:PREDICTED: uncharacterized protein LOC104597959 [Nelumbo nucifera]|uniref:Uncharacterized protein LOC104597959 n=1 Tax=Nelumbo nucifera TaxID=4432 RepID=A0A1U7ZUL1_NELNU|nr:PREDICTED: uncharacterized protein LOC104597959 [Nelumbo nucifera]XP_010258075.1 PREDICTED: uncharacterized protein LOC104597959 [Nelumbo nucifera]